MEIQILNGPGSASARLQLIAGESCTAEAGSMIAMSGDMDITTTTHKRGGKANPLKAMKRLLAGESLFLNHYTAGPRGGEVHLASNLVGDMMQYPLQGENLIVQGGSFVACESGVEIDLGWQGMKSMFSGESLFWLHLVGTGKVVVNSFGAIYPMAVDGEFIVDTGHIVAFNETLDFSISKAGKSWFSSFLGGEGLVCRFQGKGTVWCQSHNPGSFGGGLRPMLKPR